MKTLSIVVPAYNVEKYIHRCLNSFIDSNIMEELEVIIVNDGSTDNTESIVNEFVSKYPDTFKIINKKNGGHGSTVNIGIEFATGKYFRVIDGDDWVDTKSFAQSIKKIREINTDIVSMHYDRVDMITGEVTPVEEINVEYEKRYLFEEINIEKRYFTLASTCFKTILLKELGIKFQEHTYFVDVEYIIMPIKEVNDVTFLNLSVYKYFVGNVEQSINISNMVKRYDHHERVVKSCMEFIKSSTLRPNHQKYIEHILKKVLYTHYSILTMYNEDKENGSKLAKQFDEYFQVTLPSLYEKFYKEYSFIRRLKRYGFNYARYEGSLDHKFLVFATRIRNKINRLINMIRNIKRILF